MAEWKPKAGLVEVPGIRQMTRDKEPDGQGMNPPMKYSTRFQNRSAWVSALPPWSITSARLETDPRDARRATYLRRLSSERCERGGFGQLAFLVALDKFSADFFRDAYIIKGLASLLTLGERHRIDFFETEIHRHGRRVSTSALHPSR